MESTCEHRLRSIDWSGYAAPFSARAAEVPCAGWLLHPWSPSLADASTASAKRRLLILRSSRVPCAMRSPQTQPVTTKAQERSRPAAHEPMYIHAVLLHSSVALWLRKPPTIRALVHEMR